MFGSDKNSGKNNDPSEDSKDPQEKNKKKIEESPLGPPKIGVALGGGIARGFAHIGALRALERHNIKPQIVAGTSIGALVGGCYLAGKLDALEEWGLSLSGFKMLSYLDFKVRHSGVIGGDRFRRVMESQLGKEIMIEDLPCPFTAVATDMVTGHEVWIRKGNLIDALIASFSVPGMFPPMERNGRFLIDGALVNPVPVSVCQALGARMTIAVDLNADMIGKAAASDGKNVRAFGYDLLDDDNIPLRSRERMKKNKLTRNLFGRADKDHPSLTGVMVSTLSIVLGRLTRSRMAGDPPDIHVKPHIGHIGLMEFDRAKEMIEEGEAAVERMLPEILSAKHIFFPNHEETLY